MERTFAFVSAAALMLVTSASGARSNSAKVEDQDLALQALRRGEVLPITRILALARARLPGEIVEVELESDDGRVLYEVKILTRTGAVRELLLDARTGSFVAIKDD